MLRHRMSLTIKVKNCKCFLMVSIILTMLFTTSMARPNFESLLSNELTNDLMQQPQQHQDNLYLDEIIATTNGDKLFNKLKKYHKLPTDLNKWPSLRDLVFNLDYYGNNDMEESSEFFNKNFLDRLIQLASSKPEAYDEGTSDDNGETNLIPLKNYKSSASLSANQLNFKDHNIKKNIQYMSPCHFKICNMGRKRNAHLLKNY